MSGSPEGVDTALFIQKMKGQRVSVMDHAIGLLIFKDFVIGKEPTWFRQKFPRLKEMCRRNGTTFPAVIPLEIQIPEKDLNQRYIERDIENLNQVNRLENFHFGNESRYVMVLAYSEVSTKQRFEGIQPKLMAKYGLLDSSLFNPEVSLEDLKEEYDIASNMVSPLFSQSLEIAIAMRTGEWPDLPYEHTQPLSYIPKAALDRA